MGTENGALLEKKITYTRSELAEYVGKRITVEGRIQKFGEYEDTNLRRTVPTVCIQDVDKIEDKGKGKTDFRWSLCKYVWVGFASPIIESGADKGDVVRMSCLVYSYRDADPNDPNKTITRYSMRDPVGVDVVRKLSIVPVPRNSGPVPMIQTTNISTPQLPPEPKPATDDRPQAVMGAIADLIDKYGLSKVEKALGAYKMMQE